MFIPILGIAIPLPELMLILFAVAFIYLATYDFELRQMRKILIKFRKGEEQMIDTVMVIKDNLSGIRGMPPEKREK